LKIIFILLTVVLGGGFAYLKFVRKSIPEFLKKILPEKIINFIVPQAAPIALTPAALGMPAPIALTPPPPTSTQTISQTGGKRKTRRTRK